VTRSQIKSCESSSIHEIYGLMRMSTAGSPLEPKKEPSSLSGIGVFCNVDGWLIMKRVLASAAMGAALLASASSEASAWVCLAAGAGSSGYGRDPYYVQDAKIIALRTCERRSPIPICTIVWCRPGTR
jgi:hypothetical protein